MAKKNKSKKKAPPQRKKARRRPVDIGVIAAKVKVLAKKKASADIDFHCARKQNKKAPNMALLVLKKLAVVVREYIRYAETGQYYGSEAFERLAQHPSCPYSASLLRQLAGYGELSDDEVNAQVRKGLPEREAILAGTGRLSASRRKS